MRLVPGASWAVIYIQSFQMGWYVHSTSYSVNSLVNIAHRLVATPQAGPMTYKIWIHPCPSCWRTVVNWALRYNVKLPTWVMQCQDISSISLRLTEIRIWWNMQPILRWIQHMWIDPSLGELSSLRTDVALHLDLKTFVRSVWRGVVYAISLRRSGQAWVISGQKFLDASIWDVRFRVIQGLKRHPIRRWSMLTAHGAAFENLRDLNSP